MLLRQLEFLSEPTGDDLMSSYPLRLRIEITEDDINKGEAKQPSSCPIALAVERMFPDAFGISVTDEIRIDGYRYRGAKVSDFVESFDSGGYVEPCIIEVSRDESESF